jgi:rare lipoprotein A
MKRLVIVLSLAILLSSCSHKRVAVVVPPAPAPGPAKNVPAGSASIESGEARLPESELPTIDVPSGTKPLSVETGIASWYGAPYHTRRGSNGEIYDMHAMTAAHRTLPLGSVVRVTEVQTGKTALVRITDRGPFIEGRIIDLSQAAAQKIGLIQKGTAQVRVELLQKPVRAEGDGRWAVQIGGFGREEAARDVADHISHRYHTAKVLTFNSPVGDWWVRVRVKGDLRARAEEVLRDAKTSQAAIFLVRLD